MSHEHLFLRQMDNFVVQSKALWELPWLYEEASSISNDAKMQRRRRRRQTRKLKTPPSAWDAKTLDNSDGEGRI